MKELLLVGFNTFAGIGMAANISEVVRPLDITVKNIDTKDYNLPVGYFASDDSFAQTHGVAGRIFELTQSAKKSGPFTGPEISRRVIIMCGISRDEVDSLLATLSACGVTKDDLKAVLTPVNSCFTISQLAEELAKEHRAVTK